MEDTVESIEAVRCAMGGMRSFERVKAIEFDIVVGVCGGEKCGVSGVAGFELNALACTSACSSATTWRVMAECSSSWPVTFLAGLGARGYRTPPVVVSGVWFWLWVARVGVVVVGGIGRFRPGVDGDNGIGELAVLRTAIEAREGVAA